MFRGLMKMMLYKLGTLLEIEGRDFSLIEMFIYIQMLACVFHYRLHNSIKSF